MSVHHLSPTKACEVTIKIASTFQEETEAQKGRIPPQAVTMPSPMPVV